MIGILSKMTFLFIQRGLLRLKFQLPILRGGSRGPGLLLDSLSSALSSALACLPQAPRLSQVCLLCVVWTIQGAAPRWGALECTVPHTGGTCGLGNFTPGTAQLLSPLEAGGHFYSLEWTCPSQGCPRNLELPGHWLFTPSPSLFFSEPFIPLAQLQ